MSVSEWFVRSKRLLNPYGEAVADTISDALVVIGPTGRLAHANDAYFDLFPADRRKANGLTVVDLARIWGAADLPLMLSEAAFAGSSSRRFHAAPPQEGQVLHCSARRVGPGGFVLSLRRDSTEAAPDEPVLRTQELSHRVKNSLQLIAAFVASESRRGGADAEGLAIVGSQICAMGVLYDVMARAGSGDLVRGDLLIAEMAEALRGSILRHRPDVSLEVEAEPLELPARRAEPLALVVNELATNAVKHAFPERGGRIVIALRRHGESLVLTVSDNGVGFDGVEGRGLGSRYVRAFVAELGGVMSCDTGPGGSRYEIRAPFARGSARNGQIQEVAAPASRYAGNQ